MSYLRHSICGSEFEVYERYRPIRRIGSGAYGEVCAFDNMETGERVAIKKIPKAFQSSLIAGRTLREIMLLRHLDHENIISIKDLIVPARKDDLQDVYIVYELMDTDLHQIVRSSKLDDKYCQFFIYQLLRGMKYLHSANILHRDLKPSNILVNCNDCMLKIADFGLARTSSEDEFLTEYVVTRPYRAPELLLGSRMYTSAVDIWSAGCIFVEMLLGSPLFPVSSKQDHPVHHLKLIAQVLGSPEESDLGFLTHGDARRQIYNFLSGHKMQPLASTFPNIDPQAWDLAERMLRFDPKKRITAVEALNHPYVATLHDPNDEPDCSTSFDFDTYHSSLTTDLIKDIIWKEAESIHSQRLLQRSI